MQVRQADRCSRSESKLSTCGCGIEQQSLCSRTPGLPNTVPCQALGDPAHTGTHMLSADTCRPYNLMQTACAQHIHTNRVAQKHELQLPGHLVDGTIKGAPGAAVSLLESMYEQLTGKKWVAVLQGRLIGLCASLC